jgi:hypothetical protein
MRHRFKKGSDLMKTYLRVGTGSQTLALLFAACGLVACTTQEAKSDAGTGGKTGGSGGTTGGGVGGGAGGQYATSDGVACLPPQASGLITDFTPAPPPDGGAADASVADGGGAVATDQIRFGDDATTLSGGEFYYPNASSTSAYQITSDVSGGNWHVKGTVGDFSGFGLYYDSCSRIDASAFKGISFTISGTVQGGSLTFEVDTLSDTIAASWLNTHAGTAMPTDPGRCIPVSTAVNQYAQTDCAPAIKAIAVTSTPTPMTVLWSDFAGGKPQATVTPSDIIGIRWVLPNPAGVGTASVVTYPLDIVVDNLAFIPQ